MENTLRPGAQGTDKYVNRFGDRLVCVYHRVDREAAKRYTTVELILDERPCLPTGQRPLRAGPDEVCQVRIEAHETALQKLARANNGRWDRESKTWLFHSADVERCCLLQRMVQDTKPRSG